MTSAFGDDVELTFVGSNNDTDERLFVYSESRAARSASMVASGCPIMAVVHDDKVDVSWVMGNPCSVEIALKRRRVVEKFHRNTGQDD